MAERAAHRWVAAAEVTAPVTKPHDKTKSTYVRSTSTDPRKRDGFQSESEIRDGLIWYNREGWCGAGPISESLSGSVSVYLRVGYLWREGGPPRAVHLSRLKWRTLTIWASQVGEPGLFPELKLMEVYHTSLRIT